MVLDKSYEIINTVANWHNALSHIKGSGYLAFDTETTGLNVRKDKVIGYSFSGEIGKGYYMPLYYYDVESKELKKHPINNSVDHFILLHELASKDLLMWNASYDIRIVKNDLGLDLTNALLADIMLMKHTVQEEGNFRLKDVAIEYQEQIGLDMEKEANEEQLALKASIEKNGGSSTKSNYELYKADLYDIGIYACADVDLTLRLGELFADKLAEEGLEELFYDKEVMPLYKEVTIKMEEKGIALDLDLINYTQKGIIEDMSILEEQVIYDIMNTDAGQSWLNWYLNEKYPVNNKGKFGQYVCEYFNLNIPKTKSGKYSLTKKSIKQERPCIATGFLLGNSELKSEDVYNIQYQMHLDKEGKLLNISSKKQLAEIVFDFMNIEPVSKTDKGSPQFNDTMIQKLEDLGFEWARKLGNYNKLVKIKGAYIDRFLDAQEDGIFYPSFFQHRTISGRYGSDMQQLNRPKEEGELDPLVLKYNNIIRKFFISGDGRSFIDNDYESLEPHVFAHVSGDEGLRDIFRKGHDFYSTIAIVTEGLKGVSADKKAENYLGKVDKPLRQKAKAYCFTKDTLVDTVKGSVSISKIKVGDYVNTRQGYKPVEKLFNRKANTILVHTNRGTLECTEDHPFLVGGEWKEASELQKGDLLLYSNKENTSDDIEYARLPIYSNFYFKNGGNRKLGDLTLTEEWAYFVGAILGDGVISISQKDSKNGHGLKGYVGICGLESDGFLKHIEYFLNSLGYKMRVSEDRGDFKSLITVNSELAKIVYDTLQLGDMEASKKVKNLKVPDYIMKSPREVKLAFLAGLFDTDGYIKNSNGKMSINLCSKDHRLSTGVVRLLNELGVKASYRLDYNKTYKRNYYLVSISREGGKVLNKLGMSYYMKCVRKKTALKAYGEYTPTYKSRLKDPQVIKIEKGKKENVYDIRVKDCHEFYANGILVHNCLGVPYGMKGFALGKTLGIDTEEAEELIEGYLSGFPDLRKWMGNSEDMAKHLGYVQSEVGRKRHLDKVKYLYKIHGDKLLDFKYRNKLSKKYGKEEVYKMYKDYKNGLNNAKNFQIQSLSASIVNMAAIEINRELISRGIDGWVSLQIHDQLVVNVPVEKEEECRVLVQEIMENNYKISLQLKAPAEIGKNLYDAH